MEADRNAPVFSEGEISVAASAERVWDILADFGNWPSWNAEINSVTLEGPVLHPLDPPTTALERSRALVAQELHAVGVADVTNQLPANARGHLHHQTGRARIMRARRRLGAASPKLASGVYIDR
jgi:hypothetical protein